MTIQHKHSKKLEVIVKQSHYISNIQKRLFFLGNSILNLVINFKKFAIDEIDDIVGGQPNEEDILEKYIKKNNYFLEEYVEPIFNNYRKKYTITKLNAAPDLKSDSVNNIINLENHPSLEIIPQNLENYNHYYQNINNALLDGRKLLLSELITNTKLSKVEILLTIFYFNDTFLITPTGNFFYNEDLLIELNPHVNQTSKEK